MLSELQSLTVFSFFPIFLPLESPSILSITLLFLCPDYVLSVPVCQPLSTISIWTSLCWFKLECVWNWTHLSPRIWLLDSHCPISDSGPSSLPYQGSQKPWSSHWFFPYLPNHALTMLASSLCCSSDPSPCPHSPGLGFYCHVTMGTSAVSRFLLSSCHSSWYHIGYLWTQLCSHSFLTAWVEYLLAACREKKAINLAFKASYIFFFV